MSINSIFQIIIYITVLLICVKPLGKYMAKVYSGQTVWLEKLIGPLEALFYKLAGINRNSEMSWQQYAGSLIFFSFASFLTLYAILKWQKLCPLNPQNFENLTNHLAFNTAISFVTNTNWQSYSGESSLSYFSQMVGLTVQNFLSSAVGMAVLIAFIRGFVRKNINTIGNFWVDLLRGAFYILLPLSVSLALLLGSQGVVQTFSSYIKVPAVENTSTTATMTEYAVGPAASQIAIKQLGSNGGGFFNTNSAHPFENPTPFSNFLQMLAILLIPAALCHTFGVMIGDERQGFAVLLAMILIFLPLAFFGVEQEQAGNTHLASLNVDQKASEIAPGGNMEGKELRFGIVNSALWASATSATSNGSVNSMHDSFTPLGGLVPLLFIQLGEVIFGGVGSGLYGMLIYVIITVFIAGLMVGRTPEYLGKKIQAFEIKMASLAILIPPILVLLGTSIGVLYGKSGIFNPGAQGFSEILYAFSSCANNNGSAFAGLSTNTPFYNAILGVCMLFGRYGVIIAVLAIAGSLAAKNTVPRTVGTLSTDKLLFIIFLIGTIIMVGVLTFIPSIVLGPVVEYFEKVSA